MTAITYTAVDRGYLVTSHSATTSYDIEYGMGTITQDFKHHGFVSTALDGTQAVTNHRLQRKWRLETVPLSTTASTGELAWMEEFLTSVMYGEAFTFDAYGSIATPVDAVSVLLVKDSVRFSRVASMGQTATPAMKVAFEVMAAT